MPTAAARPLPRRPRRRRPTTTRRWSRWPPATAASRPSTSCTCGTIRSRALPVGVRRADGSLRPAYAAVRAATARAKRGRAGRQVTWRHATRVVGGRAQFGPDPRRVLPADELGLQRNRRGDLLRRRHLPRRREQAGAKPGSATGAGRRDDDGRKCPRRLEPAPALRLALPEARPVRLCGAAAREHEPAAEHRARQPHVRRPLAARVVRARLGRGSASDRYARAARGRLRQRRHLRRGGRHVERIGRMARAVARDPLSPSSASSRCATGSSRRRLELCVEDAAAAIEAARAAGVQELALLGFSMGGAVAVQISPRRPRFGSSRASTPGSRGSSSSRCSAGGGSRSRMARWTRRCR